MTPLYSLYIYRTSISEFISKLSVFGGSINTLLYLDLGNLSMLRTKGRAAYKGMNSASHEEIALAADTSAVLL